MRSYHQLMFDETVDGTTAVYTNPKLNTLLAMADTLEITGTATNVSGGGTLTISVQVEVSPDNRNWVARNATPEVNAQTISSSALTVFGGVSAAGGNAMLAGFARLKITLGGTTPRASLRVFVTGRGEQVLRV